ncbi:MAG: 2-isopropylmalate synthase [Deltaproteobacteria bacterium]|nr:2-isopropylmalate synthase [Deltaproteobacteria bacterium]MCL5792386.1 2-isopropylmalate synthase [Deltaproteobacteria bacterium]
MNNKIIIFDTTLRDGEQSPGSSMNMQEKLNVAQQLKKMNVDVIEAGFPIASDGDFEAVREIAKSVKGITIAGLARTNKDDIERAYEALKYADKPRIHTFVATSDIHLKSKLKKTREEVVEMTGNAVALAKRFTDDVEFSAEDATRSDRDYLVKIFQTAIDSGATTINIPDTVGYAILEEFSELVKYIIGRIKAPETLVVSVHCHNDLGLAVANSLAALKMGARQIECTINGIGERAGNAAMEEIVMALKTRKGFFDFYTDIVTEQIYPSSRLLSQITGISVQPNKAIVGTNAFAHEAGIHQDGVLKEKLTYEIMTPQSIGLPSNMLVLGKHSGRHAFRERLNALGYELKDEQVDRAFIVFKQIADKKKEVYDEDIEAIIADEVFKWSEKYRLESLNIASGTDMLPTATVKISIDGNAVTESGHGDGPVDAVYKTITSITKTRSRLLRYQVNAITGGTDAQGEVSVRIEEDNHTVSGTGSDTDIIVASAKAYINALNKLEQKKNNRIKGF